MPDPARIEMARQLLVQPVAKSSPLGLLAAAFATALSALLMAGAMVLGPTFGA